MRAAFTSLLAFAAAAYAIGDAVVMNESTDTIYLWSVSNTTGEQVTIKPGSFELPTPEMPFLHSRT
jgi:hypothetical protein